MREWERGSESLLTHYMRRRGKKVSNSSPHIVQLESPSFLSFSISSLLSLESTGRKSSIHIWKCTCIHLPHAHWHTAGFKAYFQFLKKKSSLKSEREKRQKYGLSVWTHIIKAMNIDESVCAIRSLYLSIVQLFYFSSFRLDLNLKFLFYVHTCIAYTGHHTTTTRLF
jgi:hypothetical protein